MQPAWFMHINLYIQGSEAGDVCGLCEEDKEKLFEVWKGIVDVASKYSASMSNEVQQIIVSTLAYCIIVFDLMNQKIKKKKREVHMT